MTLPVSVPTPEELDEHKEKDKEPSSLPYSGEVAPFNWTT